MSNIWERFDNIATPQEVNDAKVEFAPIEAGEYEAVLEEFAPAENRDGLPMIKGKFRTTTNRIVFYNQLLQNLNYPNMTAKNIAEAVEVVGALLGQDLEFTSLSDLASKVYEVPLNTTYRIEVSYGAKDFDKKYAKVKVLSKETGTGFMNVPDGLDAELPFN